VYIAGNHFFLVYSVVFTECCLKTFAQGHNKPITALTVTADRKEIYTACSDGNICILSCMVKNGHDQPKAKMLTYCKFWSFCRT